jgi:hypothetical protein
VHYETLATSNTTKKGLPIFLMVENLLEKFINGLMFFLLGQKKMQGIRRDGTSSCIDFAKCLQYGGFHKDLSWLGWFISCLPI